MTITEAGPFNREEEVKAFEDTKAGVKGLVDAGIVNIPRIFIRPPNELAEELSHQKSSHSQLPIIDLCDIQRSDRRKEIVNLLGDASENWGFFQVVNHGIPLNLLEKTIVAVREFHEQDAEVKKELYSRDRTKVVRYSTSNELLLAPSASWRDSLTISVRTSDHRYRNEIPAICRDTTFEYIQEVKKLGNTLFELLSEALVLEPGHLEALECGESSSLNCHYYPACPEPELTLGAFKHSDPSFLTILLQDAIGGLQVLHENQWVDVPPIQGSVVVNIGRILQMLTNDRFKSVQHRVLSNSVGPRISVACFFNGSITNPEKHYGPIKELTSEENPPLYREFQMSEIGVSIKAMKPNGSDLDYFKL